MSELSLNPSITRKICVLSVSVPSQHLSLPLTGPGLLASLGPECPTSYTRCLLSHPAACRFQNNRRSVTLFHNLGIEPALVTEVLRLSWASAWPWRLFTHRWLGPTPQVLIGTRRDLGLWFENASQVTGQDTWH